jgi:hypothetical protein
MDYELNIISRDQIPSDIYLCERSKEKEWELIHLVEFNNGLKCIQGSNYPQEAKDIIDSIKNELDYIIDIDTPEELQEYYHDDFESFYKYKDCVKIWNYYHNNKDLIIEAYNSYFKEDSDNEESDEEELDKDLVKKYIKKYCEIYFDEAIGKICEKVLNKLKK